MIQFILLHVTFLCFFFFFQYHLLKKLSFPHCIFLVHFMYINWPYICGFISLLSVLFDWSVCLSSRLYHIVLITIALLKYSLKSGSKTHLALFFSLKVALTIHDLLWFHTNFRIVYSVCEKCHWNLDRDCTESIDCFGQYEDFF